MAGVSTGGASTGNATEVGASGRDVRSINWQMKAIKFPAYHRVGQRVGARVEVESRAKALDQSGRAGVTAPVPG